MYVNATGMGALNCPGDPGCPGNLDSSINFANIGVPDAVLAADGASNLYQQWTKGELPIPKPQSSSPLSGISGTTIAIAGASLFGLVILMKAVR